MPTYEYACRSCGEHLEVVQSFKDDPLTECPSCNGTLRKVFSPIGISFKGSGFYKTDSRSSSSSSSSSGSTSSDTSKSSEASKPSESSKPAESSSPSSSSSPSEKTAAAS